MLVIRIELWPGGDESRKQDLGTATITNDGTGTPATGNYVFKILKCAKYARADNVGRVWKQGRVTCWARQSKLLGPWDLLLACLASAIGGRQPKSNSTSQRKEQSWINKL